jgi:hypothetical protein
MTLPLGSTRRWTLPGGPRSRGIHAEVDAPGEGKWRQSMAPVQFILFLGDRKWGRLPRQLRDASLQILKFGFRCRPSGVNANGANLSSFFA